MVSRDRPLGTSLLGLKSAPAERKPDKRRLRFLGPCEKLQKLPGFFRPRIPRNQDRQVVSVLLQANNVARITSEFHAAIRNLSGNLIAYVEAICVVGFLVMAILQSAKDLTPARAWFNRSWLRAWLFEKAEVVNIDEKPESSPGIQNMMPEAPKPDRSTALKQFVDAAEESILRTATAGDSRAFYQMQLEQLCGQLNAVAQAALGTPKLYWEFVTLFGSLAGSADLKSVRTGEDGDSSYPDALGRVAQSMQRSIDAIQIAAGASWKRYLRWTALILSYAILSAAAWLNSLSTSSMWWFLVMLTGVWFAGVNIAGSIRPKDLHARDREIPWKEPPTRWILFSFGRFSSLSRIKEGCAAIPCLLEAPVNSNLGYLGSSTWELLAQVWQSSSIFEKNSRPTGKKTIQPGGYSLLASAGFFLWSPRLSLAPLKESSRKSGAAFLSCSPGVGFPASLLRSPVIWS